MTSPAPRAVPHNVPTALSSLVGRAREVDAVAHALGDARLVTLIGPGGAGKTRLAREVAAADVERRTHADGVWWVELAPVGAGADVGATVAATLGATLPPGRPVAEVLAEALQGAGGAPGRVLLVLDNCEHVVDDVAALAEQLLRAAPGLVVLATSREALAIEGEVAWPVPPLARPALGAAPVDGAAAVAPFEAVQLFVERARAAVPGFALTDANAAAVATICARLDGLPLALELAAAVLPALGVEPLAARLHDALGLLARGRRTALPRHRTLRAVLDWSYQLLADDERALLRRLSVFRGPFTLDAAEAVCTRPDVADDLVGDAVRALGRLVEHSLVDVREDGGEVRYRLLETVRQYGAALLDGTPDGRETRARHARWVAGMAAAAEPLLFSPARGRTVERLMRDVDEIRAALAWATRRVDGRPVGEPMTAVRLAGALGWFWYSGVPWEEGRALLAATIAAADAEGIADADRPLADRVALGTFFYPYTGLHYFAGDTTAIMTLTTRELALWDAVDAAAAADPTALTAAQRLAAARGRSLAHQLRALGHAMRGEREPALPEMARSIAAAEAVGDGWLAAVMTMRLALVHLVNGDAAAADAAWRRAIPMLRALGEWWFLSLTHEGMAAGALTTGDLAAAAHDGRLSLRVLRAERDEWFASRALDTLAAVLAAADARHVAAGRTDAANATAAVRLLGAAEAMRRRRGTRVMGPDLERQHAVIAAMRARLGDAAYDATFADGEAMTLDEAFAFADDDAHFAGVAAVAPAVAAAAAAPVAAPASVVAAPVAAAAGTAAGTAVSGAPQVLRLGVLGPFAMAQGDVPLPADALPVGKGRELLLYLLLHEQATKEDIALALWPDASPAKVRNTFHVTLHHLRRQLGDPRWIAHERGTYRVARAPADGMVLDADVDAVLAAAARLRDLARRQSARGAARGAAPAAAADGVLDAARAALERLRGDLAQGTVTEDWLTAHRDHVHGAWADGMDALARLLAATGRPADALEVCERLVAREPLRESAHRLLMEALVALGQVARARAHYGRLVQVLQREVGVRPSRETQALAAALTA